MRGSLAACFPDRAVTASAENVDQCAQVQASPPPQHPDPAAL